MYIRFLNIMLIRISLIGIKFYKIKIVEFNSLTDLEARKRATTVYLADRLLRLKVMVTISDVLNLSDSHKN